MGSDQRKIRAKRITMITKYLYWVLIIVALIAIVRVFSGSNEDIEDGRLDSLSSVIVSANDSALAIAEQLLSERDSLRLSLERSEELLGYHSSVSRDLRKQLALRDTFLLQIDSVPSRSYDSILNILRNE